jgi:hypothetical protein
MKSKIKNNIETFEKILDKPGIGLLLLQSHGNSEKLNEVSQVLYAAYKEETQSHHEKLSEDEFRELLIDALNLAVEEFQKIKILLLTT